MKKFYFDGRIGVDSEKRIVWFADTKMTHDFRSPLIYEPGNGIYESDEELEADFRIRETLRPGAMDIKRAVLYRDHFTCQKCGRRVTDKTSHLDHIKPVQEFASFREATSRENVQTLCLNCHAAKTRREKTK